MCRQVIKIVIAKSRGGFRFRKPGVFTQCRHRIWRRWHGRPGRFCTRECFAGKRGDLYRGKLWQEVPDRDVPEEVKDHLYVLSIERE